MPTFIKPGFWEKKVKGYKEWLNLDQLIESKTPTSTYKVYTALLTQSGGDNPVSLYAPSNLTIGVTYTIYDPGIGAEADFTNVGAPNNLEGTQFVATGTTPNSWGIDAVLKYNTGAPVVKVLENSIGNIWFVYENPGYYFVKSDGLFTDFKTFSIIGNVMDLDGYPAPVGITYIGDINSITIQTSPFQSNTDGLLNKTPIEIRVYN